MQREEAGAEAPQIAIESDETTTTAKGINIKPLVRVVHRNILLIAGLTGIMGIALWKMGANTPKTYAGNFQLLVEPVSSEAKLVEPTALARSGNPSDFALDYPTQLLILKSPEMLSGIVEQVKQRYPKFTLSALQKGLLVERIGKGRFDSTKILSITYQGLNPEIVEFVLKKTADKYLKYSLEERKTNISEGVKFCNRESAPTKPNCNNCNNNTKS
jgi:polysaccharide biosynthesis transport protein